ncbi:MAG: hypothetical protein ACI89L_001445 [Phycisphaerales bacterium]
MSDTGHRGHHRRRLIVAAVLGGLAGMGSMLAVIVWASWPVTLAVVLGIGISVATWAGVRLIHSQ